jgi:competence protein ComEA
MRPGRDFGRHASRGPDPDPHPPTGGVDHDERPLSARRRIVDALADHLPPTLRGARWELGGRSVAAIVVGLVIAVCAAALVAARDTPEMINPDVVAVTTAASGDGPPSPGPDVPSTAPGTVVVHVAGLVVAPGVFELPVGSRVIDALDAAGGPQLGVDTSTLNLARVLVDGEQIAVGVPAAPDAGGGSGSAGDSAVGVPLDLNTATEADLDGLPGVGPVLASRIIAWREEHGRFTAVEELLEVTGIGTATLAELAELVRV